MKIIPHENQKLTRDMKKEIKDAFHEEYQIWKHDGQKYLGGNYELSIGEKIQIAEYDEYISIGMMKDGNDAGYLHVYGYSEVFE